MSFDISFLERRFRFGISLADKASVIGESVSEEGELSFGVILYFSIYYKVFHDWRRRKSNDPPPFFGNAIN